MKTAYLSGPIMDEHEGVARKWREIAKSLLAPNFRLLNPMRRNFRDKEVDSANEIVEFDLQDVRDADIVLVNYCKPSIGTSMEVFYASHDLGNSWSPFPLFHIKTAARGWLDTAQKFCRILKRRVNTLIPILSILYNCDR